MDHGFGLDVPETLADLCHPQRLALVVYDMQVGIVSQLPDGAEVTRTVASVLEAARSGGFRVFFTRHMSLPNEVAGVSQLRTAKAWQRARTVAEVKPSFPRDSPQFEIVRELEPRASEAVLDKITMSAFVGTPLDIALRDCGLLAFAIVGIALEVGIEPTVRHATDLGFVPVVVADACGSRDRAAAERALAGFAFAGGSFTTDVATIVPLLRGEKTSVSGARSHA
jgi:nicotinamidase-related amidase